MIIDTLDGRVKLAFAYGKSDDEIARQEEISIESVAEILRDVRLLLKITGFTSSKGTKALRVLRS